MRSFDLPSLSAGLPARSLLPGLAALPLPMRAVIEAPPGTGKTTLVPPAVANALEGASGEDGSKPGRVLVAQPRRMAARAAARRLAALSGTVLGEEVGFAVRGERRSGPDTRVEFLTSGLLLRRLLRDPELPGVGAVILDEVHERHLDADCAFGMLRELVELRDDLSLLVMSATLDSGMWADLLGQDGPASVLSAQAPTHPLETVWAPPAQRALDARGAAPAFLDHIASTAGQALDRSDSGDVLVFLPGMREVDRVADRLRTAVRGQAEVHTLSGRTPAAEQDRLLSPRPEARSGSDAGSGEAARSGSDAGTGTGADGDARSPMRRIIVSTAVAESSLTVPGVRTVVDAGLARQPRLDTVRGMSGLVTVRTSKDSATQRAGRAAREAPGRVIRCMSEAEFAALPARAPAEVSTADLTSTVLDLAAWGAPGGEGLLLPEPLPQRARALAETALREIGALDEHGRITPLGRVLAQVPADPRLGRGLLMGALWVGGRTAAEVIAALSLDLRAPGGDLTVLLSSLRAASDRPWLREARRLRELADAHRGSAEAHLASSPHLTMNAPVGRESAAAAVIALARPDRIARARPGGDGMDYLLASGTAARLPRGSSLQGSRWLAVADVERTGDAAVIRTAAPLDADLVHAVGGVLLRRREEAQWEGGRVRARLVESLGAIELSATPAAPSARARESALAAAVEQSGPDVLAPSAAFERLRCRLGLLHAVHGSPWPDVRWSALVEAFSGRLSEGAQLDWLHELLPWPQAAQLDSLVPTTVRVPSGRDVQITYPRPEEHRDDAAAPVLAVKLQECFGWASGPQVCGVPVRLSLLSPAGRPLAVTSDLESFWNGAYAQVRAENRNRYAKHPWPEDPWTAPARRGTTRSGR